MDLKHGESPIQRQFHHQMPLTDPLPPMVQQSAKPRPVEEGRPAACFNPDQEKGVMIVQPHLAKEPVTRLEHAGKAEKGMPRADLKAQSPG